MDFVFFSKVLPPLVLPFNFALLLLIVAFILPFKRLKQLFLGLSIFILFVSASPLVANFLAKKHEQQYLPYETTQQVPKVEAIIVLGGGLSPPLAPRNMPDFNGWSDRFMYAAKLYKNNIAPKIIISGGNVFQQEEGVKSEAFYTKEILVELGVKEQDILIETKSRNTYENARYSRELLKKHNLNSVLLVTSAFHMPRAYKVFKAAGIDVIPAPTDFMVVDMQKPKLLNILPNIGALSRTTLILREKLGIFVYQLKGYINKKDEA